MDYSPTPNKVKPQYAFLDDSIEMGRSEAPRAYRASPLKNQKDTETFHQRQKQFYNKYSDLSMSNSPDILKEKQRARTGQINTDTTSRLFKNISNKVPVDDVVKINSNMIEKIIRENESLKSQLKEEKKENDVLNQYANGIKEKLIKYKKLNDNLKIENEDLKKAKIEVETKLESLRSLQSLQAQAQAQSQSQPAPSQHQQQQQQSQPESPKYNFNLENVEDIFGSNDDNASSDFPTRTKVASTKIEERIESLENQVTKISTNQDEKFDYIKNEIEFLKNLSLQMKQNKNVNDGNDKNVDSDDNDNEVNENKDEKDEKDDLVPKEDDLIVKESLELKQLQEQIDLFTKKLQLREDNKLKKYTLNKELEKLAQRLQTEDIPSQMNATINIQEVTPLQSLQQQQQEKEVHTPINQTSPSSGAKSQAKPGNFPKPPSTVRERLDPMCDHCGNNPCSPQCTPRQTAKSQKSTNRNDGNNRNNNADDGINQDNKSKAHVPSFKIGDTLWH